MNNDKMVLARDKFGLATHTAYRLTAGGRKPGQHCGRTVDLWRVIDEATKKAYIMNRQSLQTLTERLNNAPAR